MAGKLLSNCSRQRSLKFRSTDKSLFFPILKKRIDNYFAEHRLSPNGNFALVLKTAIMLVLYLLPLGLIITLDLSWAGSLLLWTAMGLATAGLGMSVMHDANHGAYSRSKSVNWIMAHILNLMGASTTNWKLQHNILHHTYTNITGMDDDIASKPALRLSPHSARSGIHRYQWWHAFILYSLTTLYWVTAKDFLQLIRYHKDGVYGVSKRQMRIQLVKLSILKISYFAVFLGVPLFFAASAGKVIVGFLVMHIVAGLILTVIFQLAHSLEGPEHPLPDGRGIINNDWAMHQMQTTMDFSPRNVWLSWYLGGLNFQVEHHLFPKISHVHYPAISVIVRRTAAEFGVPYLVHDRFADALKGHIRYLKNLGRAPDWKEAIG